MALNAAQIEQAWLDLVHQDGAVAQTFAKPALRAAVSAVDAWATSNQASYVAALPEPFKSGSTAAQKALVLAYVCLRRAGL